MRLQAWIVTGGPKKTRIKSRHCSRALLRSTDQPAVTRFGLEAVSYATIEDYLEKQRPSADAQAAVASLSNLRSGDNAVGVPPNRK